MKSFVSLQQRLTQSKLAKLAMGTGVMFATEMAMAATTGAEYKKVADMIKGWAEGYLGMTLALAAFIIGLAIGLMMQTIMPAVVGIGVCLAATLGPGIIISFFTAVI